MLTVDCCAWCQQPIYHGEGHAVWDPDCSTPACVCIYCRPVMVLIVIETPIDECAGCGEPIFPGDPCWITARQTITPRRICLGCRPEGEEFKGVEGPYDRPLEVYVDHPRFVDVHGGVIENGPTLGGPEFTDTMELLAVMRCNTLPPNCCRSRP